MKKLRVAHYPQLPCEPFRVEVGSVSEAVKIMDILADYDLFQYENNIKPDYANLTILEEYRPEEGEWYDWCDEETGIDCPHEFKEYVESLD